MEADAGFVERLPTVRVFAQVGEQLQTEKDIFIQVRSRLDFARMVVVMMV